MRPNTQSFLTSVNYIPEKRQVTVEFSNKEGKFSRRYSFFPKMHFSQEKISKENFFAVLPKDCVQKIRVTFNEKNATVFAATFSDLKRINNLLRKCFGVEYNLIEPERQFLIEKGWGYFDCFDVKDEPILVDSSFFPDVTFDFLSDSLRETINDLLVNNKALARELVYRIVSSRLLKIPLVGREDSRDLDDAFLENIFFESGKPVSLESKQAKTFEKYFFGKSKIDFSKLVMLLSARPFSNLGFESLNCNCCKPVSVDSENVLPSSLVKVKFLRDGFYFDSISKTWAESFHDSHDFNEERSARKREYFSQHFPTGPFFRNKEEFILLGDALGLSRNGFVEILSENDFEWFCVEKESALSKRVNYLKNTLVVLDASLKKESDLVVASKGLFYSQSLDLNPDFFYKKTLEKIVSKIFSSLPISFSNLNSRFFDKKLAVCFESVLGNIFRDFEEVVASSSNSRVSFADSSALLDSSELLSVSRKFAELYSVDRQFLGLKPS
ncbi:MAG TPA: hypothetical protein VFF13_02930 [archaeon]|nr:hypothetical protein [archaeon]